MASLRQSSLPHPRSLLASLYLLLSLGASQFPAATWALPVAPFSLGSGPITFTFAVRRFTPDGYIMYINSFNRDARCRKVLGWNLAWGNPNGQFIWSMTGAQVKNRGDCSLITNYGGKTPYSCSEVPYLTDTRNPGTANSLVLLRPAADCRTHLCGQLLHAVKVIVGNATNTVAGFERPRVYRMPGHMCTLPAKAPLAAPKCPAKYLVAWQITCRPI